MLVDIHEVDEWPCGEREREDLVECSIEMMLSSCIQIHPNTYISVGIHISKYIGLAQDNWLGG